MRRLINPLMALTALATVVASLALVARPAAAATDPSVAAGQFFGLLNQSRIEHGLPVLARDAGLDRLAVDWSTQMQGVYAKTQTITGSGDCSTHALCHRPNLGPSVAAIE